MPTVEESIEAALFARAASLTFTPALPVSWPNVSFTPPAGPHLKVQHFPNGSQRLFAKGSNPHILAGILQITAVAPLNSGSVPATQMAGKITEHFPADLPMTSGDVRVRVTQRPSQAPPIKTDATWEVPVSIPYEAFA